MILDLDGEMQALQSHEIRTHKDVLKYFTARYSSFTTPNYPLDAPLPAFALAQHGFYFEAHTRLLKCAACDFTSADLYEDLLVSVLYKHLRASPACDQARHSLRTILTEPIVDNEQSSLAINQAVSGGSKRSARSVDLPSSASGQFLSEEARIRSFENEKLLISAIKLAANGFYRVPKQDVMLGKEKSSLCLTLLILFSI